MGYQFLKINPYEDCKQILLFKISRKYSLNKSAGNYLLKVNNINTRSVKYIQS